MADRLFHSIKETWDNVMTSPADVKELVPEFFSCPDFLQNKTGFNFGVRQDGQVVDHVQLPPWARNAHDFVTIHRMALESEFVSEHLHKWLDLIFGCKQQVCPCPSCSWSSRYSPPWESVSGRANHHQE